MQQQKQQNQEDKAKTENKEKEDSKTDEDDSQDQNPDNNNVSDKENQQGQNKGEDEPIQEQDEGKQGDPKERQKGKEPKDDGESKAIKPEEIKASWKQYNRQKRKVRKRQILRIKGKRKAVKKTGPTYYCCTFSKCVTNGQNITLTQSVQELLWISMKPLESRLQQMQEEEITPPNFEQFIVVSGPYQSSQTNNH